MSTSEYVSIRQLTSAYVSLRQLTSAYVSLRQHIDLGRWHGGQGERAKHRYLFWACRLLTYACVMSEKKKKRSRKKKRAGPVSYVLSSVSSKDVSKSIKCLTHTQHLSTPVCIHVFCLRSCLDTCDRSVSQLCMHTQHAHSCALHPHSRASPADTVND